MMTTNTTAVADIRPLARSDTETLASTENQRVLELLTSLTDEDWAQPTDCPGWNVRDLAGHVLGGIESFCSYRSIVHAMRSAKKEVGEGAFIDAMTAVQVRERASLATSELLARLASAGPRSARFRQGVPAPLRAVPMKQELLSGETEKWTMGYLLDTILTRDTWMHRVDVARATKRPLVLTPEHDGRIVADAVAEWARRHGQPMAIELTGPAGGSFSSGRGDESLTLDAVEFCRLVSGRGSGEGLLAQEVPF